ncbi:hypothetical protein DYH09_12265 [bacterium CPR1]|nr:hypothetical protein [bacterium CPR1]
MDGLHQHVAKVPIVGTRSDPSVPGWPSSGRSVLDGPSLQLGADTTCSPVCWPCYHEKTHQGLPPGCLEQVRPMVADWADLQRV